MKRYLFFLVFATMLSAQEERNVLAEIFTNSHCPPCVTAHNTMNGYLETSPNGDRIITIYYHMLYPYNDDPLYHHNSVDSDGRDDYYNPIQATPRGFFDGQAQGSVTTWASNLDNLTAVESPIRINLIGTKLDEGFNIKAEIMRTGDVSENDLVIHFVVVEDINYTGRNGVAHHENVMRDMVDGAQGSSFSINLNESKEIEKQIVLNQVWIKDSLKVVVFIQSSSNKTVYQSAIINYSELNDPTNVGTDLNLPDQFQLEQNYPNPFNPSTTIRYQLPEENFVTLKIFNLLGKEISTLVNRKQQAGFYDFTFNAGSFPSGIYFYKLVAVNSIGKELVQTKKMTLIK